MRARCSTCSFNADATRLQLLRKQSFSLRTYKLRYYGAAKSINSAAKR